MLLFEQKFKAGGKPSTWFPPGGLVEQRNHADKRPTPTNKHADKAREHSSKKQKSREEKRRKSKREDETRRERKK